MIDMCMMRYKLLKCARIEFSCVKNTSPPQTGGGVPPHSETRTIVSQDFIISLPKIIFTPFPSATEPLQAEGVGIIHSTHPVLVKLPTTSEHQPLKSPHGCSSMVIN